MKALLFALSLCFGLALPGLSQPIQVFRYATWNRDSLIWARDSVRTRNTYNAAGLLVRTASKTYGPNVADSATLSTHAYDAAGRDTAYYQYQRLGTTWDKQSKSSYTYAGASTKPLTRKLFSYSQGRISTGYLILYTYDSDGRLTEERQQEYNYFLGYRDISLNTYHYPRPGFAGYDTLTYAGATRAGDPLVPYERAVYGWFNFALNQDSTQLIQEYSVPLGRWVSAGFYRRQWPGGTTDRIEYYYNGTSSGRLYLAGRGGLATTGRTTHIFFLDYDSTNHRYDSSNSAFDNHDANGNSIGFTDYGFSGSQRYLEHSQRHDFIYINGGPSIRRVTNYAADDGVNFEPRSRYDYESYLPMATLSFAFGTWQVSPNPAQDWATVKFPPGAPIPPEVTLQNVEGRAVATALVAGRQARIYVQGLPPGVYTLRAATATQSFTGQLIKQ